MASMISAQLSSGCSFLGESHKHLERYYSNVHFDVLVCFGTVVSYAFSGNSYLTVGLGGYVLVSVIDRLAKIYITGDLNVFDYFEDWKSEFIIRVTEVITEECAYAGILLGEEKNGLPFILRVLLAYNVALLALNSFRHDSVDQGDRWDVIGAITWTFSREVVLETSSSSTYLAYVVASNAITYALIGKLRIKGGDDFQTYRFVSDLFFRSITDLTAIYTGSMVAPFAQRSLFHFSRVLPDYY